MCCSSAAKLTQHRLFHTLLALEKENTMKLKSLLAVAVTILLVSAPLLAGDKGEDKLKDVKCPLSGKQVTDCTVAYKGGKVYFCCGKCAKAFKADLKKEAKDRKFTAKANQQLYATKQAKLEKCPLTGRKLNPATAIEVAGTKVCFCCGGCKSKVEKADDPVEVVFNDENFKKGFKLPEKKKGEKK